MTYQCQENFLKSKRNGDFEKGEGEDRYIFECPLGVSYEVDHRFVHLAEEEIKQVCKSYCPDRDMLTVN